MEITIGSYRLLGTLGEGGMGYVFLAEHIHTGRRAVIKSLRPEYVQNAVLVQRFYEEARILSQLSHPSIVRLYDFYIENSTPYLVMEYVQGRSLEELFQEHPEGLGVSTTYAILRPILEALAYVHSQGIIHRDIKPSNIIVLVEGGAKLLDFGIAKALDSDLKLTQTGTQVGTALYMAPEQIQNTPVSPRTDLYAIGLLIYQGIFGRYPWAWEGKTLFQIYQTILQEPVPFPSSVPQAWQDFFQKALAKRPSDRFSSAMEMVEAFTALIYPTSYSASQTTNSSQGTPRASAEEGTPAPSRPRIETLDAPPTGHHRSKPQENTRTEKESFASKLTSWLISLGAGVVLILLLILGYKLLGYILRGLIWYFQSAERVPWLLIIFSLSGWWASEEKSFLRGLSKVILFFCSILLIYFHIYAWPKAKKIALSDALIHSALQTELNWYEADFEQKRADNSANLEFIRPLPEPLSLQENLSFKDFLRILLRKVYPLYLPAGKYRLPLQVSYIQSNQKPFEEKEPCSDSYGYEGTRWTGYTVQWEEKCILKGTGTIQYSFDLEEKKLLKFEVKLPEDWKPTCEVIPNSEKRYLRYSTGCY